MGTFYRLKKEVGDFIIEKFKGICCNCGSTKNICVHHVQPMFPNNPEYNNIDNLILLCRSCHMSHHQKQGDIIKKGFIRNGRRGNVPPIKCKIDGCDRMQHGKHLCKKHYEYFRRKNYFNDETILPYPFL